MIDQIKTLGVFGAGTMGTGIAINAIANGINTRLADTSPEAQVQAMSRAEKVLARWADKGRMSEAEKRAALARLTPASLEHAAGSDIVIEAIFEDLGVKRDLLRRIDSYLGPDSVVATNTSALRVGDISTALSDPGRLVGLHYFSPAEVNPLCELISAAGSDPRSIAKAQAFLDQTGRVTLACGDTPGFIVNRFFIPIYDEAVRLLDEGVATAGEVDLVSRDLFEAGAGIITVLNVIGARTAAHAAENLGELGPTYAPGSYLGQLGASNAKIDFDPFDGEVDAAKRKIIEDRLLGAVLMPVTELVDQGLATLSQIDDGARHALKFARPPGRIIDEIGMAHAQKLVTVFLASRRDAVSEITQA